MVAPGGACVVALGGMHGCSGGMCVVALGGACVVALRGMRGCSGGCAWLLRGGACVVAPGGMRGCSGGMCGCSRGGVRGCCPGRVRDPLEKLMITLFLTSDDATTWSLAEDNLLFTASATPAEHHDSYK